MCEDFKPCDVLNSSEYCLVVEQYTNGMIERKFHKHVPKSRISKDMLDSLLRALLVRFSEIGAETIVHAHLNKRGFRRGHAETMVQARLNKREYKPPADESFYITRRNSEAGARRTYCGCNTIVWYEYWLEARSECK
jgi:hypothetical protein